jgi:GNAT superfamily N-acetyltransferase
MTGASGVDAPETLTGEGMQIRLAHTTDAAAVNGLLHQLGYPQDDTATTATRIQTWGDDPASAAYVADADGDLLGLVAVHICPFFERTGSWGRIVALIVTGHARGQSVGGQLVTAAELFATSRGCVRMEVTSADRRQDAHEFYRRCGYTDQTGTSSRFLRDLDAPTVMKINSCQELDAGQLPLASPRTVSRRLRESRASGIARGQGQA